MGERMPMMVVLGIWIMHAVSGAGLRSDEHFFFKPAHYGRTQWIKPRNPNDETLADHGFGSE